MKKISDRGESLAVRKFHSSKQQQCFRDVLIRGGNAVDAAIATAICTGALHPHATGFGGGMVMLVHDR